MSASPLAAIAHSLSPDELRKICRDICAAAALEQIAGSQSVHAPLIEDAELLAILGRRLRASPAEARLVVWS
jgi:hypothetical protein